MTPLEPDRDQLEQFVDATLRHIGSERGFFSVRSFFEGDARKPFRVTSASLKGGLRYLLEVAEDDARRAAQAPRPIVFCPPLCSFSSKEQAREQDILAGLTLSVECDRNPQQARKVLEALLGPATVVVQSGGTWVNGSGELEAKVHLHWRLTRPAAGADLAALKQARALAARIVGGDPSNTPINHPIRWPGSWHRKAEPRLCTIETLNPDIEIDLGASLRVLKQAMPEPNADSDPIRAATGDDWPALVGQILSGESYHAPLVALAARLAGSNVLGGTIVKLLRSLMDSSRGPRDQRWEHRYDAIPRYVHSAQEKYQSGPDTDADADAKAAEINLHWHGDADQVGARAWLIDGLLPESGCGLASGQWGTFKTFAALDLAAAVMAGGHFIDRNHAVSRRGGVLYIAPEGAAEIPIRLQAVLETKYPGLERAPFAWTAWCPPLLDSDSADILAAMAQQAAERMQSAFNLPLALIIVDTLVAAAGFRKGGEENDAALSQTIMRQLTVLAQATGALVLAIDHMGKIAETGTRGSSAKEGAADVVLALLGTKSVTGTITDTRLALRKSRAGASGGEFAFAVRAVDLDNATSLVIDWQAESPQPAAKKDGTGWAKSLRLLRRVLMNVLADHGRELKPYANGPTVRAVDLEIVRHEYYQSYPAAEADAKKNQEAKRKAFSRAVRDAQERDLISVREVDEKTLVWLVHLSTATIPSVEIRSAGQTGQS